MSRAKKAVIIAAIMIGIGVVTSITALAVNGFRWPNVRIDLKNMKSASLEYVKKTKNIDEEFKSVDVQGAPDMDVEIKKSDSGKSYVEYYECDGLTDHIEVAGDVLKITADDDRHIFVDFTFGMDMSKWLRITVYLADTQYDDIQVKTSSGDVSMQYYLGVKNLDIETSSGDVDVNGVNADSIYVMTSSGDMSLDSVSAKNIELRASSGDIKANSVVAEENTKFVTSSGDMTVDGITASNISCSASSGDIVLRKSDAEQYDVSAKSGDVRIEVSADEKYRYETTTSSGDVNVPDSADGADRVCSVRTSSGDIDVTQ